MCRVANIRRSRVGTIMNCTPLSYVPEGEASGTVVSHRVTKREMRDAVCGYRGRKNSRGRDDDADDDVWMKK
jgi:hypothetical protein